ncbi:hypothetical protein ACFYQT_40335 [Streptomyces tibetensis]|uniref:Uncharacterized protein n=1 Tax=Streptomyces tibetensis TaxID=2382123 RepID=A0ABW6NAK6_9ACTN
MHGDGGPEDVAEALAGLDDTAKNALIVVLAGLVDPEQPVGKALGWLDFNEHGALTVPASWSEDRSVRDLAPEPDVEGDDEYVDQAAVTRFVKGFPVEVTDAEFLVAVQRCVALEMTLGDVDRLRGWSSKTAEKWVNRIRKQYQRSGREFPSLARPSARVFTEAEVVAIRERAAGGASDRDIAMSYAVTRETIRSICRGQRYAQYGGPIRAARGVQPSKASREYMCGHADLSLAGGYQARNAALTPEDRMAVRQRTENGEAVKQLAAEYEVHTNTIRNYAA